MFCKICEIERKEVLLEAGHGGSSFRMIGCGHRVVYKQAEGESWYDMKDNEMRSYNVLGKIVFCAVDR